MRAIKHRVSHPLHVLVGLDLITTGGVLLFDKHYFFWPPWPEWITGLENNSIVGICGVALGLGMLIWARSRNRPSSVDHWLITLATAYYTIISMTELAHVAFGNRGFQPYMAMDAMGDLIMVGIALYMAKQSDSKTEGDEDR